MFKFFESPVASVQIIWDTEYYTHLFSSPQEKALTESDLTSGQQRRLRPVKSAESLTSGQNSARSSRCLEPPSPPTPAHTGPPGHNRSQSHDSYFDHLTETRYQNHAGLLPEEDEEGVLLSLLLSKI